MTAPGDNNPEETLALGHPDEVAAWWLIQREEGFSPEQARAFEQWRDAHPEHAAALARAEQTTARLEKLPFAAGRVAQHQRPLQTAAPVEQRRGRVAWLAVAAAAVLAVAATGWWTSDRAAGPAVRYATAAGGYQRVMLADGSRVELNANTAVEVRYAKRERHVVLVSGEAHFHVTSDAARPFIVAAGSVAVRAVGTAFNVRLGERAVEVLVTHGAVRVSSQSHSGQPMRLTEVEPGPADPLVQAGERVLVTREPSPAPPQVETITPDAIRQALSWQERKLVFVETPLRQAVEEFNRQNHVQLTLGDPSLNDRPLGGTFAADNVEAFVRLLEMSGDIVAERRSEREIVLRRSP